MNGQAVSNIITYVFIIFTVLLWAILTVRYFKNKFSVTITVKARVIDKYIREGYSKTPNILKGKLYVVVFLVDDKPLSLYVSQFSYSNYKLKEKGTLTYRGNRVIDFK